MSGPMSAAAIRRPRARAALLWRRFLRHRLAVASGLLLLVLVLLSLAAPLIEHWLGVVQWQTDLLSRLQGPSLAHPLGTDELGRDLLARLLHGGRVSLFVGLVAALASTVIGTALGLLAGYHGGRLDALLMRLTDGVIALPLLPLLIVLAAVDHRLNFLEILSAIQGTSRMHQFPNAPLINDRAHPEARRRPPSKPTALGVTMLV